MNHRCRIACLTPRPADTPTHISLAGPMTCGKSIHSRGMSNTPRACCRSERHWLCTVMASTHILWPCEMYRGGSALLVLRQGALRVDCSGEIFFCMNGLAYSYRYNIVLFCLASGHLPGNRRQSTAPSSPTMTQKNHGLHFLANRVKISHTLGRHASSCASRLGNQTSPNGNPT